VRTAPRASRTAAELGPGLAGRPVLEILAGGAQGLQLRPHPARQRRHPAQRIDHRALDAVVREGLEAGALAGVETRGGLGQAGVAERDELVELDVVAAARVDRCRHLAREVEVGLDQRSPFAVIHAANIPRSATRAAPRAG
jgi:hypothetical protein